MKANCKNVKLERSKRRGNEQRIILPRLFRYSDRILCNTSQPARVSLSLSPSVKSARTLARPKTHSRSARKALARFRTHITRQPAFPARLSRRRVILRFFVTSQRAKIRKRQPANPIPAYDINHKQHRRTAGISIVRFSTITPVIYEPATLMNE